MARVSLYGTAQLLGQAFRGLLAKFDKDQPEWDKWREEGDDE